MPEVITTYLGRESPAVRHLVGKHIPCSHSSRGGRGRTCDAFGFQLGLASLPGDSNTECHDAAGRELFDILQEARLPIELQPRHYFDTLIPVATLLHTGRNPSIVPDACITVALPELDMQTGAQTGPARARRRHFFDVKTLHAGNEHYYSRRAREEQSGAVRTRELMVWAAYQHHARQLDRRFSQGGDQILQRLRSFGRTRGLVFGAYGEASADVHTLIGSAAEAQASQVWREAGARSASEMRAVLIGRMRRRVGLATVQAMARHRLARVPYVGVSHAVVQARAQRRVMHTGSAWVHDAQDIYLDLATYQGGGGGGHGMW